MKLILKYQLSRDQFNPSKLNSRLMHPFGFYFYLVFKKFPGDFYRESLQGNIYLKHYAYISSETSSVNF